MLLTKTLTKKGLELIIHESFSNFGTFSTCSLLDSLKFLGFYYSTASGLSITIDDLKTPEEKSLLIKETERNLEKITQDWQQGLISDTERFQKIITLWNTATESLKNRIVDYYEKFDPTNSLYIMAFSGARGNMSQVRQLIGMRGLMADQAGKIISLPIQTNFREGLSTIDYIISSYGARKGVVDTALKTANAGYLTRRLVYSARNVIIKLDNCKTKQGIDIIFTEKTPLQTIIGKTIISYNISNFSLEGKVFNEKIFNEFKKRLQKEKIQQTKILDPLNFFENKTNHFRIKLRSPLTCLLTTSVCKKCYGWDLAKRSFIALGDAVGVIAGQSIGEPGTQLTMRTFHTGGIYTSEILQQNCAPFAGKVIFSCDFKGKIFRTLEGDNLVKVEQDTSIFLYDWKGKKQEIALEAGSYLHVSNSQFIKQNQVISEGRQVESFSQLELKPVYSIFDGQILFEKNIKISLDGNKRLKNSGIFWILSGKIYQLPSETLYSYPSLLTSKKAFATLKLSTPYGGRIRIKNQTIPEKREIEKRLFPFSSQKQFQSEKVIYLEKSIINKKEIIPFIKTDHSKKVSKSKKYFDQKIIEKNLKNSFHLKYFNNYFESTSKLQKLKELSDFLFLRFYYKNNDLPFSYFSNKKYSYVKKNLKNNLIKIPVDFFITPITKKAKFTQNFDCLVKNYQYVDPNTVLGIISFYPLNQGKIFKIKIEKSKGNSRITYYFLTESDIWEINSDQLSQTFLSSSNIGKKIVHRGNLFTSTLKSLQSGILIKKDGFRFIFQRAQPIFLPEGTKFKHENNSFVQEHTFLAALRNYTKENQDIIQGLPKIDRLIEARKGGKKALLSSTIGIFIKKNFILTSSLSEKNRPNEIFFKIGLSNDEYLQSLFSLNHSLKKKYRNENIPGGKKNILQSPLRKKHLVYFKNNLWRLKRVLFPQYFLETGASTQLNYTVLFEKRKKKGELFFYNGKGKIKKKDIFYWDYLEPNLFRYTISFIHSSKKKFDKIHYYELVNTFVLRKQIAPLKNNGEFIDLVENLDLGKLKAQTLIKHLSKYLQSLIGIRKGSIKASQQMQLILLNSIQAIYYSQGVTISNKHLEIILRPMFSYGSVKKSGFTPFSRGEKASLRLLVETSKAIEKAKLPFSRNFKNLIKRRSFDIIEAPIYTASMRSTTKSALGGNPNAKGFLASAGFQQVKNVLLKAAMRGRSDWIVGLKEHIITGRLLPSGTSFFVKKRLYDNVFQIKDKLKENNINITSKKLDSLESNKFLE